MSYSTGGAIEQVGSGTTGMGLGTTFVRVDRVGISGYEEFFANSIGGPIGVDAAATLNEGSSSFVPFLARRPNRDREALS